MRNGLLIWNVLLTIIAGYLLFMHFRSGKSISAKENLSSNDSARVNKDFRIAYFEMDSVEANFEMVKDVKAELSKKEDAINSELEGMSRKFQQRYKYFQEQAQGGTMTQAQSEAASQELKNMDDQMKARKQNLDQEYSEFTVKKMKDIKGRIEDFLKESGIPWIHNTYLTHHLPNDDLDMFVIDTNTLQAINFLDLVYNVLLYGKRSLNGKYVLW